MYKGAFLRWYPLSTPALRTQSSKLRYSAALVSLRSRVTEERAPRESTTRQHIGKGKSLKTSNGCNEPSSIHRRCIELCNPSCRVPSGCRHKAALRPICAFKMEMQAKVQCLFQVLIAAATVHHATRKANLSHPLYEKRMCEVNSNVRVFAE